MAVFCGAPPTLPPLPPPGLLAPPPDTFLVEAPPPKRWGCPWQSWSVSNRCFRQKFFRHVVHVTGTSWGGNRKWATPLHQHQCHYYTTSFFLHPGTLHLLEICIAKYLLIQLIFASAYVLIHYNSSYIVRFVILALILYVHVYLDKKRTRMYIHTGPVHLDAITDFSVGVFPPIDWDWLVTQRTHWHPCILRRETEKHKHKQKLNRCHYRQRHFRL